MLQAAFNQQFRINIANQFFDLLFPRLLFASFRRSSDRTEPKKANGNWQDDFPRHAILVINILWWNGETTYETRKQKRRRRIRHPTLPGRGCNSLIVIAGYFFGWACAIYCMRFFSVFIPFYRLIFSARFFSAERQRSTATRWMKQKNIKWNRWRAINHCHRQRTTTNEIGFFRWATIREEVVCAWCERTREASESKQLVCIVLRVHISINHISETNLNRNSVRRRFPLRFIRSIGFSCENRRTSRIVFPEKCEWNGH